MTNNNSTDYQITTTMSCGREQYIVSIGEPVMREYYPGFVLPETQLYFDSLQEVLDWALAQDAS